MLAWRPANAHPAVTSFSSSHKNKRPLMAVFLCCYYSLDKKMNKLSNTFIVLSYRQTMKPGRKKVPVTHRLVFIDGVLDTPAALGDPGGVEHWDGWHSKHWRGQREVDTGRRDLLVDIRRVR